MSHSKLLFVIDELEYKWFEFNKLVTNFWFIKEFLKRNFEVFVTTKSKLFIKNAKGCTICNITNIENNGEISYSKNEQILEIEYFNFVFFRPDPPVDVDYINACNIFEFVDLNKVKVKINIIKLRY